MRLLSLAHDVCISGGSDENEDDDSDGVVLFEVAQPGELIVKLDGCGGSGDG